MKWLRVLPVDLPDLERLVYLPDLPHPLPNGSMPSSPTRAPSRTCAATSAWTDLHGPLRSREPDSRLWAGAVTTQQSPTRQLLRTSSQRKPCQSPLPRLPHWISWKATPGHNFPRCFVPCPGTWTWPTPRKPTWLPVHQHAKRGTYSVTSQASEVSLHATPDEIRGATVPFGEGNPLGELGLKELPASPRSYRIPKQK